MGEPIVFSVRANIVLTRFNSLGRHYIEAMILTTRQCVGPEPTNRAHPPDWFTSIGIGNSASWSSYLSKWLPKQAQSPNILGPRTTLTASGSRIVGKYRSSLLGLVRLKFSVYVPSSHLVYPSAENFSCYLYLAIPALVIGASI